MDTTATAPEHFLGDYLFRESPARLLVVGQLPEVLLSRPIAGVEVHRLDNLHQAESLVATSAMSAGEQEVLSSSLVLQLSTDSADPQQRLGRAVRACPHRVLVHCQHTTEHPMPADEVFFALGFKRLTIVPGSDQSSSSSVRWFEYRLSQYKASPDWLNARFWANPERFDSEEDPDDYYEDTDDYEEE